MGNKAVVNIFDKKDDAAANLKELTDAGHDASIVGPVERVKVVDHYGTGGQGFSTPAGAAYYLVIGSNKTKT